MSSIARLSRFGKLTAAAATGTIGGAIYLYRDAIKPYISNHEKAISSIQTNAEQAAQPHIIENLPSHVPYLLIGGGTASHSAMRAIRSHDPKAKVLIVSKENRTPYMRPALSKELWFTDPPLRRDLKYKWYNGKERSIFYEIDEFFIPIDKLTERETGGVSIVNNTRLQRLDPDNNSAFLENGQVIKYDKCLLAPGGKPKSLPELDSLPDDIKERVLYFRTADDFLKLEEISRKANKILVIGGGLLGTELTCALAKRSPDEKLLQNQNIYQIFPEIGSLGKLLPPYLSQWLTMKLSKDGAKIVPNAAIKNVTKSDSQTISVELTNGTKIEADYVVCAIGIEPDVDLARSSSLEVDEKTGGFLVNSELEARTDVWVAGDASCYYDIKLGRRRVEHHDHAVYSGRQAGLNMVGAGESRAYKHQSMFWSDIGSEISFEAVGLIDSNLRTVGVFCEEGDIFKPNDNADADVSLNISNENSPLQTADSPTNSDQGTQNDQPSGYRVVSLPPASEDEKFSRGMVFYLDDSDVIVGILTWNIFGRLKIARRILNEQKKYEDLNEVSKLFNLYVED